jgi:CRP-like cAMP-binding protein
LSSRHRHPNHLLAALHPDDFTRLQPHLRPRTFAVRDNLEQPNVAIRRVVFPASGMLSIVAHEGEYELEVGIIGREGMTGTALVLGGNSSPQECFVQIAGEGVELDASEFKRALADRPSLRMSLLRYVNALLLQTAQTAVANGRCTVDERLARWLLMSQDRVGRPEIPLTHEFLSIMLGVRRPSITEAIQLLEGAGAIRNQRGLIHILRRDKLEDLAGGAYRALDLVH